MSKPRHKRKRKFVDGETVHVTRHLSATDVVEYDAIFHLRSAQYAEGESVQCVLEPIRLNVIRRLKEARDYFASFRINRDWWSISAIPVELSRHTCVGKTQTAVVMAMMY